MALTDAERVHIHHRRQKERRRVDTARGRRLASRGWSWPKNPTKAFVKYCHTLTVPEGLRAGRPFRIMQWQKDYCDLALAPDTSIACLSIARRAGKSGLIAMLCCSFLDPRSPLFLPAFRGLVLSRTADLAVALLNSMERICLASGVPLDFYRTPVPGTVKHLESGGELRILAADKAASHARGSDIGIIDEVGLLDDARHLHLFESVMSGTQDSPIGRCLLVGTRGSNKLFGQILAQARAGTRGIKAIEYAAPDDVQIDDPKGWKAANPSLGILARRSDYRNKAELALNVPVLQAGFRRWFLNQSIDDTIETLVTKSDWQNIEKKELPEKIGPVAIGFDLGASLAMTAAVCLWPETGRCEFLACFPGIPTASARGKLDGVDSLYEDCVRDGSLHLLGGRTPDIDAFMSKLSDLVGDSTIIGFGADGFRKSEVISACAGTAFEGWAMDFRANSGARGRAIHAYDIRSARAMIYDGKISVLKNPLWYLALASARVKTSELGHPELKKAANTARMDIVSALCIACGISAEYGDEEPFEEIDVPGMMG